MRSIAFPLTAPRVALALVLIGVFAGAWAKPGTDGVVALRSNAGRASKDQVELRVARCIAPEFPPPLALGVEAPAGALRDALFPWLDPSVLPRQPEVLAALLATKPIADKLDALGVRYLVNFMARSLGREERNALAAIPYLGAYGIYQDDVLYGLDITVWDAREKRMLDAGHTEWKRTLGVLGVVLPIPFRYTTEAQACDVLLAAVREIIRPNH